ncbi:hypothetical protein ACH470_31720 [Streptomyces bottropensis]|uniref:hypothetical protein n=1 Tax=Streptomyces bottropensis TaxID=42235 RepID=UPI0037A30907
MADNQNPQGNYDPAGSTQMFRAFVDETPSGGRQVVSGAAGGSGPRVGVIVGVLAAVAVVAAVVWLALA